MKTSIRKSDIAVVAFFVTGMLLPLLDNVARLDHSKSLGENRATTTAPTFPKTEDELRKFPRAFDGYWNDRFGFRRALIRLNARANFAFGVSSSDQVIIGKGGRLFFTGENSVEIYRGQKPMSAGELTQWQKELEARRDWLAGQGIAYFFFVAPNKETIYGDAMPQAYSKVGPTRLEQLLEHMKTHSNMEIIDVRQMLKSRSETAQVYALTDTHWTDEGGFIGYRELSNRVATRFPAITVRSYESFKAALPTRWYGDLAQMLGMNDLLAEERVELVPGSPYRSRVNPDRPGVGGGHLTYMLGRADLPRAVVFHDSFFLPPEERGDPSRAATAAKLAHQSSFRMVALLAEHFSESTFKWTHDFDPSLVLTEHPNVVIQEMVERGLRGGPPGRAPR